MDEAPITKPDTDTIKMPSRASCKLITFHGTSYFSLVDFALENFCILCLTNEMKLERSCTRFDQSYVITREGRFIREGIYELDLETTGRDTGTRS